MASRLTPDERAEMENADAASVELVRTGTTARRCLRCGGELRVRQPKPGGGYQVVCEREQRVIIESRA
jgi:ssDNA-binding Zn-finger/Zn-ribbon topoisomerase 1